ncbi:MAG: hypothetical protein WCJ64_09890 [Rhodospirillaceae bacterium]
MPDMKNGDALGDGLIEDDLISARKPANAGTVIVAYPAEIWMPIVDTPSLETLADEFLHDLLIAAIALSAKIRRDILISISCHRK